MASALAAAKQIPVAIPDELWDEAGWLPCLVSVDLPVRRFTVRDLLQLEVGAVLETNITDGADVSVMVNSQLIGWAEFEMVGEKLAVRMTELG
jgi:flagellar motor switch/type III secretory pathway protein FliN